MEPIDISTAQSHFSGGIMLSTRTVRLCQAVATGPVRLLTHALRQSLDLQLQTSDLKPEVTYVIIANHQSMLDPFMIMGSLSRPLWQRITPCRFFAHSGLFRNPIKRIILMGLGCFPTRARGNLAYGLPAAEQLLAQNESVLIFPQGRRTRNQSELKPGIAHLASLPGVMLIPVRLEWTKRAGIPRLNLVVGRPFSAAGNTAPEIMEHVYTLPLKEL